MAVNQPPAPESKWNDDFVDQAYKLALLGMTDKEMAKFFDVSERTLNNWKLEKPSLLQSIKKGKELADADVSEKLFRRAIGYEHPEVDIKMFKGQIIKTELVKHYPPDTTAAIIWLKNRQKKKWRDKQEVEHTGIPNELADVTDKELDERIRAHLDRRRGTDQTA